jgi:beta-aspartyl-peptidase (threonine type)
MLVRAATANDICARMTFGSQKLQTAAHEVFMKRLSAINGRGGLIPAGALGNVVMPFNTAGICREHARMGEMLNMVTSL